ncbi:MAG: DUF1801 domain-containing protein [Planctomycetes bacterium]|nr:DUF1801 domain-containing protein [Planctomycetota bacterium]
MSKKARPKLAQPAPRKSPARRPTAAKPAAARPARAAAAGSAAVDALLDASRHPLRAELDLVRRIVRSADRSITEEVKWNAPTFRTSESFATLNGPRHVEEVLIVLHAGARARGLDLRAAIADPAGLLEWRGRDRALVRLGAAAEIRARGAALRALVRAWIRHV